MYREVLATWKKLYTQNSNCTHKSYHHDHVCPYLCGRAGSSAVNIPMFLMYLSCYWSFLLEQNSGIHWIFKCIVAAICVRKWVILFTFSGFRHFCWGSVAFTMWIFKCPKQILEGSSIEMNSIFSHFGEVYWALRWISTRALLDFQVPGALSSGPPRALPVGSNESFISGDYDLMEFID